MKLNLKECFNLISIDLYDLKTALITNSSFIFSINDLNKITLYKKGMENEDIINDDIAEMITISPNNNYCLFIRDNSLMLLANDVLKEIIIVDKLHCDYFIISNDSKYILLFIDQSLIEIYDLMGNLLRRDNFNYKSPNSRSLITLEQCYNEQYLIFHDPYNRSSFVYDINGLSVKQIYKFPQKYLDMGEGLGSTAISLDKNYFIGKTFRDDERVPIILVWDLQTSKLLREIFEEPDEFYGSGGHNLYFSNASKYLVMDNSREVFIYETDNFNRILSLDNACGSCISQDNKYLGYYDLEKKVYNVCEITN